MDALLSALKAAPNPFISSSPVGSLPAASLENTWRKKTRHQEICFDQEPQAP
jgi:hypothetical protein